MNDKELIGKVHSAVYHQCQRRGYADDFVCLFQYENEAQKFYQLLIERLKKFGLEIAEDKSRILPFGRYKGKL